MRSFDLYDTLITRLVAAPADVFRLMEERLSWPGFCALRVAAELAARRRQPRREVTLEAIYQQLAATPARRSAAMQLELHLETTLTAPVQANLTRLRANDIVVSDIYLPRALLADVLLAHGAPAGLQVIASSDVGLRKAEGLLWDHLIDRGLRPSLHVGDNAISDVRQPQRRGIAAEHYTRAVTLNRHEKALARSSLDGSVLAGCARAARLGRDWGAPQHTQLAEVFASAIAPALIAFVDHVLDECARLNIHRIGFLARDGQLPYRIALLRIAQRGLPLSATYVYGSRRSLHLPGFTDIESAESWLLEDTPVLTLTDLAGRASLPVNDVCRWADQHGLSYAPTQNIPAPRRVGLRALIREPEFVDALTQAASNAWQATHAYYHEAGYGRREPMALVDVGWNGRMQASLRRLIDKSGEPGAHIHGFYLCLLQKLAASPKDRLEGFAHDPDRDTGPNALAGYRAVLEAFLEADHGSTLGFALENGKARAVLDEPPRGEPLRAVHTQQDAVLDTVLQLGRAELAMGRTVRWNKPLVLERLKSLLQNPLPGEARAFGGRARAEGQVEDRTEELVRQLSFGPDLWTRRRMGFWPEAAVSASGYAWMLPILAAARYLRHMKAGTPRPSPSAA